MTEDAPCRLEFKGISKSYPGVLANDQVSFSVRPGEVHALLGENGAGKSTLVKMIYGIIQPDQGEIWLNGEKLNVPNPKAARKLGVGMVFQHFSLFQAMTVLENIALGLDEKIAYSELETRIRELLDQYGLSLDLHRYVSTLSVGERQRIEIVRALLLNPSLLIMDEPTSVLTPQEVAQLFKTLKTLSASGCSILYISHKLHEIQELCHTATILRMGRVVGECDPQVETSRSMAEMMIGGDLKQIEKKPGGIFGEEKFIVKNLSLPGEGDFGIALNDISFAVRSGEIFGIAGVAGNGQNELLLALGGEVTTANSDTIRLDDTDLGHLGTMQRRDCGLCAVPEERYGHAAVADFPLYDNGFLTARNVKKMVKYGIIDNQATRGFSNSVIKGFSVKTNDCTATAGSLSGGNLQKFIMGREIMQTPEVLIVSQPTWGVDAGAAAAIHQALVDLASEGSAIVIISQDLDELLEVCDSLVVINEGSISRTLNVGDADIDEIGLLMGGVHGEPSAAHGEPSATPQSSEAHHAD